MKMQDARTREDFLDDCDPDDCKGYELLFSDIEELKTNLECRGYELRFDFKQKKGWSLLLEDPRKEILSSTASLLWGFPTNNVEQRFKTKVTTRRKDLTDASIPEQLIDAYFKDLQQTAFETRGKTECMTTASGRDKGVWITFKHDQVRSIVIAAMKSLVDGLDALKAAQS